LSEAKAAFETFSFLNEDNEDKLIETLAELSVYLDCKSNEFLQILQK